MNASGWRTLDANFNRAREAMRVLEDYSRFMLDDPALSGRLKQLRHEFRLATDRLQARAIFARDTEADCGRTLSTLTEQRRQSTAAVITAAGKRLGEALRTVEEFLKIVETSSGPSIASEGFVENVIEGEGDDDNMSVHSGGRGVSGFTSDQTDGATVGSGATGSASERVKNLRYQFYVLENEIARTLTPGRERMAAVQLHVLVTEQLASGPWETVAGLAIDGGADVLQLREKTLSDRELLSRASRLVAICRERGVVSIINDRPDVAVIAGADGVHLGQDDLPVPAVRKMVGPDMVIGLSTHNLSQARQAVRDGADYIGVGPIFPSLTKPQQVHPGLSFAYDVAVNIPLPSVGISGITVENAAQVRSTGMRAIAVSSAVISAEDPQAAAGELRKLIG